MLWKYAANFQGNEHSCRSAISIKLKVTFFENRASARVFSCTFATYFPKHLFLRTPLKGCFWTLLKIPDRARSSHPDVFLGKGVLKICSKFTAEHPWRSAISIKQPPREVPAKRCSENMQQIYNKVAYLSPLNFAESIASVWCMLWGGDCFNIGCETQSYNGNLARKRLKVSKTLLYKIKVILLANKTVVAPIYFARPLASDQRSNLWLFCFNCSGHQVGSSSFHRIINKYSIKSINLDTKIFFKTFKSFFKKPVYSY